MFHMILKCSRGLGSYYIPTKSPRPCPQLGRGTAGWTAQVYSPALTPEGLCCPEAGAGAQAARRRPRRSHAAAEETAGRRSCLITAAIYTRGSIYP